MPFLQWHLVSFPHKHGGGTYDDKCGPLENRQPVSKGWICVVGTEDCLVLKNHSHWLGKGGMLRCLVFGRLGESHTLYKKSVLWECVCLIWIYSLDTLVPATTGHGHSSSVFTVSGVCVGGISFYLGKWSLTLGCVFSKSLSCTVSLFRQCRR